MKKVRWGVLGVAKIATTKVVPAMQRGAFSEVAAIASRDLAKARDAAGRLAIPRAYGSYEELLADPDVEAIYNPLPNHLHVPWSIRALEAGKHVLCEKPVGLNVAEVRALMAARDRTGLRVGEAFMVRTHPQWIRVRELVRSGAIGDLRAVVAAFSYTNRDPRNIRNVAEWGGGGLMDIGCYAVQVSRFLFEREPVSTTGAVQRDPELGIDRLTSGLLDFESGHAVFTCGTQMVPYQRVQVIGTACRVEVQIPFNAPPDRPTRILIDDGSDLHGGGVRTETFETCDQYTIQGDLFSRAIREGGDVPTPLEDSVANMAIIEAILKTAG
jgi:predicted dehydrogenase